MQPISLRHNQPIEDKNSGTTVIDVEFRCLYVIVHCGCLGRFKIIYGLAFGLFWVLTNAGFLLEQDTFTFLSGWLRAACSTSSQKGKKK